MKHELSCFLNRIQQKIACYNKLNWLWRAIEYIRSYL